jgi:hypothetical protein
MVEERPQEQNDEENNDATNQSCYLQYGENFQSKQNINKWYSKQQSHDDLASSTFENTRECQSKKTNATVVNGVNL